MSKVYNGIQTEKQTNHAYTCKHYVYQTHQSVFQNEHQMCVPRQQSQF